MRRAQLFTWTVAVAAYFGSVLLILRFDPFGMLHACPLRALTGIPCPACGGTRACDSLLRGHVMDAFLANPALTTISVTLAGSAIAACILLPWAKQIPVPRSFAWRRAGLILVWILVVGWIYLLLKVWVAP